ncbi:MAG: hypothetical protein EBX67_04085 [Betaproteobacteria bacterium]|nr:hypothetical protein [Betaproteobacteria bacterium]
MIVTTAKLPDPEIALQTLASQVKSRAGQDQCLRHVVGIHSGGAWVARRLLALLTQDSAVGALFDPVIGYLSSAFHRDDYGHNAQRRGLSAIVKGGTELPFEVTGARILLVDDVLEQLCAFLVFWLDGDDFCFGLRVDNAGLDQLDNLERVWWVKV